MADERAATDSSGPSPEGTLGLYAAVALIMGSIVGTGIFTLRSAIAKHGMAGVVGFLVAYGYPIAQYFIIDALPAMIHRT